MPGDQVHDRLPAALVRDVGRPDSTWIRPIPFAAWCDERNISLDQVARLIFVNEAVRDQLESRRH
jgi:hypothetical protein